MKTILHVVDHMGGGQAESFVTKLYLCRQRFTKFKFVFFSLRKCINDPHGEDLVISTSKSRFNIRSFVELKNCIHKENISVVHLYLQKAVIYGLILKLLFFNKLKVIVHEHGPIFQDKWWYSTLLNMMQSKIDLFLAVSKATKKKLVNNAGIKAQKIRVLHNFVDLKEYSPQASDKNEDRHKLGIHKDDFVLGFIGRLVPLKNIDKLIKTVELFRQINPKVKLIIVGNGPEMTKLTVLVRTLNLDNNVRFLGFRKDIPNIISAFDVGLLVSDYENLSMFLLELVAMNKPIVATDVGGNSEIINEQIGKLISEPNPQLILKAVKQLSESNQMLDAFYQVKRKFSLPLFIQKLEDIYYTLIYKR